MFSLSQVLSDSHAKATRAWDRGAPKAETIDQARTLWTPLLPIWAKLIAGGFLEHLTHRVGRERVGWIDDASFWSSFWEARSKDWKVQQQSESNQMIHMRPYIEGAAAARSMSFFVMMPLDVMGIVRQVMKSTEVLMDPEVLAWYQHNDPRRDAGVTVGQSNLLRSLSWSHGEPAQLGLARGAYSMEEVVDVVCRCALMHNLEVEELCKVFGHLMARLPEAVERESIMACIQNSMAGELLEGVELSLIAMCTGYNVSEDPRHLDITALGRQLALGDIVEDSPLLVLLSAFEDIDGPEQLYSAVRSLGLHRNVPMPLTDMDGQVFVPG